MLAAADGRAEVAIAREARGTTVTFATAREPGLDTVGPIAETGIFAVMYAGLATLVAVMATGVLPVTAGAVNNPLLEMVPALADQVTAVSAVPLRRAVNCSCSWEPTVALPGESDMAGEELVGKLAKLAICEALPHPAIRPAKQSKSEDNSKFAIRFL